MLSSYALNSYGQVCANVPIFRFLDINIRIAQIKKFAIGFISSLKESGFYLSPNNVYVKIQPNYTEDRVFFFSKIPIPASASAVRLAHNLRTNLNFPVSEYKESQLDFLKSIFFVKEKEKTVWYLLVVDEISFERNLFDGEWERLRKFNSVPFHSFIKNNKKYISSEIKPNIISSEYQILGNPNFDDVNTILQKAAIRCNANTDDIVIKQSLSAQYEMFNGLSKNVYANKATVCLYLINDSKYESSVYDLYLIIKERIKTVCPTASHIFYKGRSILFDVDDKTYTMYVCASLKNSKEYVLVINGNIINNIQSITESNFGYLISPCRWYDEYVLPNIKAKG